MTTIALAQSGDERAMGEMVEANRGLVWSIVRRYMGRGVEADDLFQLGCLGLMKAVQGFSAEYGTQFSTYAVPKIAGEIRRFLRDDGVMKVSRTLKERNARIRETRLSLEQSLGREIRLSELAEATGYTAEEIMEAESAMTPTESLQRESGESGFSLEMVLGDWEQERRIVDSVTVREAVAALPDKEQKVIALRFFRGLTQCSVARILDLSQVQISRLERRALDTLRSVLSEDLPG